MTKRKASLKRKIKVLKGTDIYSTGFPAVYSKHYKHRKILIQADYHPWIKWAPVSLFWNQKRIESLKGARWWLQRTSHANACRFKRGNNFPMGRPRRQEKGCHHLLWHWKEHKSLLDGFSQEGSTQISSQMHNTGTQDSDQKESKAAFWTNCERGVPMKLQHEISTWILLFINTSLGQETTLETGLETRWQWQLSVFWLWRMSYLYQGHARVGSRWMVRNWLYNSQGR